ncbi:hybrid sensor histidine kinase/response regulator transcription factor [Prolixibacter denitrificans]|nr:response regulator [Prolixibacter denitrificans]
MGIVRYTQDDIRTYQLPYDTEDIINVHLIYKNGDLYVYTNNGQILRYNSIQDKFEMIINISKILRNPFLIVERAFVDNDGRVWLASSVGLFCYDRKSGLKSVVPNNNIQDMEWFDDTHFFYVINNLIKLFDTSNFTSQAYYEFPEKIDYSVSRLYYDNKLKSLWIGTISNGLFILKKENGIFKFTEIQDIPNQPVLAIEANSDSTMMVGIDGQGIWKINKATHHIISVYKENSDDPRSLKGNGVYDIYCDANKRVWVCTYSGGVSYFDQANPYVTQVKHIINNPNSLVNNDVNSVWEDEYGKIWFATNNGLSSWDVAGNRWKTYYHNKKEQAQVFLSVYGDKQGKIWAGTYSSGVYVIDCKTGKELEHYSSADLGDDFNCNFVFDIYEDTQKKLWIGGVQSDLICYEPGKNKFQSYPMFTYVIREYKPNKLLLGTTYGLVQFNPLTGDNENLVEGYVVRDIYVNKETVWLCTSGDGLIRYNMRSKKIKHFTIESGLPSNFVNGIMKSDGYLWLGTEKGMCRLNPENNNIATFNSILPLSHASFNTDSHSRLANGKMVWGTNRGAVIFDPKAVKIIKPQGRIFYQDLTISGQSIRDSATYHLKRPLDSLQEIRLKYYQNTVSLELIPIGVNSPGSKFSWKVEGLDNEWSKPSKNRILSYSNIQSGTYFLRIRMYDSSLSHIVDERQIVLHIIPPFWDTFWFRLSLFLFITGLGIFLFYYYINQLKKKHSEEKIRFFANTAHELRTSLTLIKGPVEELHKETNLSDKGANYLHLATEQTQRLLSVVTQLMDFQKVDVGKEKIMLTMVNIVKTVENRVMMFKSYAESKHLEIVFSSNCSEFVTAVDESIIEKVIDNLISNAIKYSYPNKQVRVVLECSSSKWELEVIDQGIGISKKAQRQLFKEYYRDDNAVNSKIVGSGIGLLLVRNYIALHDGKVSFESQLNAGSTFRISVPCKKVDESEPAQSQVSKVNESPIQSKNVNALTIKEDDSSSRPAMKVLVVEDNDYLREFLKSTLESQFTILLAGDGQKAWEFIKKEKPDLVVSDIMMPRMDGFELCRKIKSTYETAHTPVILLTSLDGKAQQMKGIGLGADDYLTKPFDVTLLQQRIKSIIKNRAVIREKALKIIKLNEDETILENELNDGFMKRLVQVVRENMANAEFSKDDFALAMNVSRSLLYKKVKSLTNQSPTDFIKSVRLDHALDLLKTRKYSITEISELCGFSSVSYFSTVFRKHYGKSPTQIG